MEITAQYNRRVTPFLFTTMAVALDPSAVLATVKDVLPPSQRVLKTPQDGIAVLLHGVMSILGFRLVGLDDSSADAQHDKNVLPDNWNAHSPNSFGFRYRHDQSSLVYLLKAVKLSKRLVIHGIALEVQPALFFPEHSCIAY